MREFTPPKPKKQIPKPLLYTVSTVSLLVGIALLGFGLIYLSQGQMVWGSVILLVFALIITVLIITPLKFIRWLAAGVGLISIIIITYQYLYVYFGNINQIKLGFVVSCSASAFLLGSYLINKSLVPKIIGALLILLGSIGTLVAAVTFPASEIMQFIINFSGCTITFLAGCYLITRQGLFFRFWGVAIIIASIVVVFSSGVYSFLKYIQPTPIEGVAKQELLFYVDPILDNMWQGYNENNYDKYSADFSSEMKEAANLKSMKDIQEVLGTYKSREIVSAEQQANTISVNYTFSFEKKDEISFYFEITEKKGKHYINAMSAQ